MTFRMVLVAMVAAAMVAAAHAHSASETTSSPGDPLHWNSVTRSWECTSLNPCADQPDLAEAKDENVLSEAKTNEASTKATILAAQAENEKALKTVQHAEAAVGRHKAKGMKNRAGAGTMLLQAQAGAAFGSDDPLHFNPAQRDPASPLSNETSICREWYISDGPVKHGSNKAAADALKSAADGNWIKGTTSRKGWTTDGTGWAVGFKHGCTEVTASWGGVFTICGCYEIWCPVRGDILSHSDDIYGRDVSGVDGSMAVRNTCYSARAVFGCYRIGNWLDNCGTTNSAGQFIKIWEQLVL